MANIPRCYRDSSDLYVLLHFHITLARRERKQPFLYVDFTRSELLPKWFTEESVGGGKAGLTDEYLPTIDPTTPSIVILHNGISKPFGKSRFLKTKEQWMLIFIIRYLPAALATQQLTLVAAITHFDNICRLYQKYIVNSKETSHLVTLYEDMLRHGWAK